MTMPLQPDAAARAVVRQLAATLAYRAAKVLRDVPPEFATRSFGVSTRVPVTIVAHMGDLMAWGVTIARRLCVERGREPRMERRGGALLRPPRDDRSRACVRYVRRLDPETDSGAAQRRTLACGPAGDAARHGRHSG